MKEDELAAMFQYFGHGIKPPFSSEPRGFMFAPFRVNQNGEMVVNRFQAVSSTAEWICDGNYFAISYVFPSTCFL